MLDYLHDTDTRGREELRPDMACIWDGQSLGLDHESIFKLPADAAQQLQSASNDRFLDILSQLALDPVYTDCIFAAYEPLFVELCSRWISHLDAISPLRVVSALARLLPYCPGLAVCAQDIAIKQRAGDWGALFHADSTSLTEVLEEELIVLLVAVSRLLEFNRHSFESLAPLPKLQVLLTHGTPAVRYLSARVISQVLCFSETAAASIGDSAMSDREPTGMFDGAEINFRYFSLWEIRRKQCMAKLLENKHQRQMSPPIEVSEGIREVSVADLSPSTVCLGGHLSPRRQNFQIPSNAVVMTRSTQLNIQRVAAALDGRRPVLVTGLSGSGKTMIVNEISAQLSKDSNMLILHLNEQTDAKLLVGVHTSDSSAGTFRWQPGVLTTAVREGRWVLIEDIDRAPAEVMSIILPQLDRNELLVPNLGGYIRAADGFKIIATKKTYLNARNEEVVPNDRQISHGLWSAVRVSHPTRTDLEHIIWDRYPRLRQKPELLAMYDTLSNFAGSARTSGNTQGVSRAIGIQELFRFCSRYDQLLATNGIGTSVDPVPEFLYNDIFIEAVDCFCAANESLAIRDKMAEIASRNLQISPARMAYCLYQRLPEFTLSTKDVKIGRIRLAKQIGRSSAKAMFSTHSHRKFAPTGPVLRLMESVGVATQMREPCLLVGETGVGKTTIVQQLATQLGKPLMVANLSQQSEVSDLLGGIKPLSARALAVPLKENFDDIFARAMLLSQNTSFAKSIDRAFNRDDWPRAIALMQKAHDSVQSYFRKLAQKADEVPAKKRKLLPSKHESLRTEWDTFATKLQAFKHHVASGDKGLIFNFVEGSLVKAVRNGDWVLLDEINLASPDTLECLSDLLHHGPDLRPFLILTETGNAQKIEVHQDFRIFGAMNPATDIGKRDLPPSIRTQFTEIFVHSPDRDADSLGSIVSAYLSEFERTEKRDVRRMTIQQACVELYQEIRRLEVENLLIDGAGQRPHFTLRTLTRALTFACEIAPSYGLRGALFHGYSMCFLTVLDAESRYRVSSIIERNLLSGLNPATLHRPKRPSDSNDYVNVEDYWIHKGELLPETPEHYILTEHVKRNLQDLARATVTRRYPVLLQGPTSSGKTSLIEYLAKRSGNRFVRINNHEHTDLQEYLGSYVSTTEGLVYQDGVLVQALRKGHWVVLDELNLAPTDVLEALNRLLDDNRELMVPETQEIIRPHPNFMLFATQNPPGMYGGRKFLSRAFRNRFLELHFNDVPENELEKILKQRCPHVPESFCSRIVQVYRKLAVLRQSDRMFEQKNSFATLRDLFRWALRNAEDRHQLALDGFMLLGERVRDENERLVVKQVIEEVMKEKIDLEELYRTEDVTWPPHGYDNTESDDVIWTLGARRLYVLIQRAILSEEPVLLVGGTGCGKTRICQALAAQHGRRLSIVNAHQHTETGDLIGSQRPIRDRAALEAKLRRLMDESLSRLNTAAGSRPFTLEECLKLFDETPQASKSRIPIELLTSIEATRARLNMLFEWSDGSLVTAMRDGEYFLLDEISLADDSVLERLNSVLEPERSVLLAEKGSVDAFVTAASTFRFLATMNPGGDYGKKELSPALRNRFTEIWVPNLSPEEDILPIVTAKLKAPVKHLAIPMLQFATWFATTFGEGPKNISIRDMLAWTEFVNVYCAKADPMFAFAHGASMVLIDGIGANPSARLSNARLPIPQLREQCLQRLGEVLNHQLSPTDLFDLRLTTERSSFGIGPFLVKRYEEKVVTSNFTFQAHTTRSNGSRLLRALQLTKPILLEGSPGVGKTALVTALAGALGRPLTRINLSDQTDIVDLFGSDVPAGDENAGHFVWRDAPFLRAMNEGQWVLLDEMNLASQTVLEGLNACLDHRGEVFVPELGKSFKKHKDFALFAAQNPHSQGGGRKGLPASFVNRFTIVYADALTDEDYGTICSEASRPQEESDIQKLVQNVVEAQGLASSSSFQGGPWEFNLRDILRWLTLMRDKTRLLSNADRRDFEHFLFFDRLRNQKDRAALKGLFRSIENVEDNHHYHYRNQGKGWYQCGFGLLMTSNLLPSQDANLSHSAPASAFETVIISIQKGWPVLLVGPSGVGKSNLLCHLATVGGQNLIKISLNQDTDAFDLIGGYQQADATREVASFLVSLKDVIRKWSLNCLLQDGSSVILQPLWQILGSMAHPPSLILIADQLRSIQSDHGFDKLSELIDTCASLQERVLTDNKARFEWVDGLLVRAVKEGFWIELENANLCPSSVLDRLNALLEPGGTLTIHEHSDRDGSPQDIVPHPNFRIFLTMDPRHGEVSRAMRNRCVEIYLDADGKRPTNMAQSVVPATLFRVRAFQAFDWSSLDATECFELARVCLENLSYSDYHDVSTWFSQNLKGLITDDEGQRDVIKRVFEAFQRLTGTDNALRAALRSLHESLLDGIDGQDSLPMDLKSFQPIHPLANFNILSRERAQQLLISHQWSWLDTSVDLAVNILASMSRLSQWIDRHCEANSGRSMFSERITSLASAVLDVHQNMLSWLESSITCPLPKVSPQNALVCSIFLHAQDCERPVRQVSEILDHISQLFQESHFEQAVFVSVWKLGHILAGMMEQNPHLAKLASIWIVQLEKLRRGSSMSSGGSMDLLWQLFKPHTFTDLRYMKFSTKLRVLADDFDAVLWRSNVSLESIIRLRGSFTRLLREAQPETWETQLQVSLTTLVMASYSCARTDNVGSLVTGATKCCLSGGTQISTIPP